MAKFETLYDFDQDGVTITINLDWIRADWILSKGSLEDSEEEHIYDAIKVAVKDAKNEGIKTDVEYDEDDDDAPWDDE